MTFDPTPYDREWFEYLKQFDAPLETAFYAVLAHLGKPKSLLDLGCGTGHLLNVARRVGVFPVTGVEISKEAARYVSPAIDLLIHDLCKPLDLDYRYDMVLCWEVAEHIPPEDADSIADTIAVHTGKWLVFTAAHEGQGGDWHLNEQPKEYWIEKFEQRGLKFRESMTEHLHDTWVWTTGPCHWYVENVMVFEREAENDG